MGGNDGSTFGRHYETINAQRALRQILPAIKREVTCPEKFSQRVRSLIFELLRLALLAPDETLTISATELLVALEGETQRREHISSKQQ